MSYPTYFGSLRHGNLHKVIRKRKKKKLLPSFFCQTDHTLSIFVET